MGAWRCKGRGELMDRRMVFKLFTLVCVLGLANGCGGGLEEKTRTGSIRFVVDWGEPTRLLPSASNGLRFVVKELRTGSQDEPQLLLTKIEPRPPGASTSEVTINGLPSVKVQIDISAHPDSVAAGNAQATGSVEATIPAGGTVDKAITLNSTIQTVVITSNQPSAIVGETLTLTARAHDARGNQVLTSPSKWLWTIVSPTIASGTTTTDQLTLDGLSPGSTVIKALERESNKEGSITVTISTAAPPPLPDCLIGTGDWLGTRYDLTVGGSLPNQLLRFRRDDPTVA